MDTFVDSQTHKDLSTKGYQFERFLEGGRCDKVMLCLCEKDSQTVVIKALKKSSNHLVEVENEIRAGEVLRKKGIIKHIESFEAGNCKYLVLDYGGEDLWHFMDDRKWSSLDENSARVIFRQVARTIYYCHQHGIAHKDIKLENILLDKKGKHTTLIDFGLSEYSPVSRLSNRFDGTLDYMPPEELLRIPFDPFKADVYELGVLLYVLLTGAFPFDWRERCRLMERGLLPKLSIRSHEISCLSKSSKDLLTRLLEPCPHRRIKLIDCVHHPWTRKGETVKDMFAVFKDKVEHLIAEDKRC